MAVTAPGIRSSQDHVKGERGRETGQQTVKSRTTNSARQQMTGRQIIVAGWHLSLSLSYFLSPLPLALPKLVFPKPTGESLCIHMEGSSISTSCLALSKLLDIAGSQLPHLWNESPTLDAFFYVNLQIVLLLRFLNPSLRNIHVHFCCVLGVGLLGHMMSECSSSRCLLRMVPSDGPKHDHGAHSQ